MNPEATRSCPYCAETIRVAAKVCPRCRQWMTVRSFSHPAVQLWITTVPPLVVVVVLGMMALVKFERMAYPRPFYTEALGSLRVTESKMNWRQTDYGLRIDLIGIVTNQSQVPWKDVEFECRFFDTNNVMSDVVHQHASMTIQPNDEAAFSLMVKPSRPTNSYSSFKLNVVTARSARAIF